MFRFAEQVDVYSILEVIASFANHGIIKAVVQYVAVLVY